MLGTAPKSSDFPQATACGVPKCTSGLIFARSLRLEDQALVGLQFQSRSNSFAAPVAMGRDCGKAANRAMLPFMADMLKLIWRGSAVGNVRERIILIRSLR